MEQIGQLSYYTKELKKITDSKNKAVQVLMTCIQAHWGHYEIFDTFFRKQVVPRKSQANLDISSQAHDQVDSDNEDDETISQGSANSEDRCITPTLTVTPRRLTGKTKEHLVVRKQYCRRQHQY